ncbi:peptidase [Pedobacter sp.]|nr:peptidase [Candidatus Saccharibacteria bacterium]
MGSNAVASGGAGIGGGGTLAATGASTGLVWLSVLGALVLIIGVGLLMVGSLRGRRDRKLLI